MKVFFLHIPKTAGTAFNEVFRSIVPSSRFISHGESKGKQFSKITKDGGPFFASGHFGIDSVESLVTSEDVYSITILRNPVEQLISHLKWVKAYGDPDKCQKRAALSPAVADLSQRLWTTKLDDVDKISELMATDIGQILFDNLQTRYLSFPKVPSVGKVECSIALKNVHKFNFIFCLEDIEEAMTYLQKALSIKNNIPKNNSALIKERVNLNDQKVRDFYRHAVSYDATVYSRVRDYSRAKFFGKPSGSGNT